MSLLQKLQLKLAKKGIVGLKHAGKYFQDDEEYVYDVVCSRGAEEFKYASKRLRSSADFLIKLSSVDEEILQYCEQDIYDVYMESDMVLIDDEPVDEIIFAHECVKNNLNAFGYLKPEVAKKYFEMAKNGEVIKGKLHGNDYEEKIQFDDYCICHMDILNIGFNY